MGGSSSKKTNPKKEERNINNPPLISEGFSVKLYNSIVSINFIFVKKNLSEQDSL